MQLTLFLNHACNLRCTYCYTGRKVDRAMPQAIIEQAIEFGLAETERKFLLVCFFGGEPMLEAERITHAVSYAKTRAAASGLHLGFGVATNGTVLPDDMLALLAKERFDVQVSLDGGEHAHDATRRYRGGASSYADVVQNIARLHQAGVRPHVVAVIDPRNAAYLADSFATLLALGIHRIQFSPNYNGAWDDASCETFEAALAALGDQMIAHFRAGKDVRLDPLNGKIVTHLNEGYRPKDRCKFGCQEVAVGPSGRLYPCDRLVGEDNNDTVCIGDVHHGLDSAKRDALIAGKNEPDGECSACELQRRCMYWCGCANFETTGSVAKTAPIVCWFERCFIATADRVANVLYGEHNPAFLRRFYVPELPLQVAD